MLRIAAFAAALVALSTPPLAGVDETDATAAEGTPLAWVATPSAGTVLETRDTTPGRPTLLLHGGRVAVAARGEGEQGVQIQAGPVSIAVTEGMVLIDHIDGVCFVVVLVGSALVHGGVSQDRGVLLQSRQGIASGADGMLADVLTFERVPRLNDPEPLALQASATADDPEAWPQDIALSALAQTQTQTTPAEAIPEVPADAESGIEPAPGAPSEAIDDAASVAVVSLTPEPMEPAAIPEAAPEIPAEPQASAHLSLSLTPAWQQRPGRR